MKYFKKVEKSVHFLKKWQKEVPEIAIVLGSGLGSAVPNLAQMQSIKYKDIPGFNESKVPGHSGELKVGKIEKRLFAFLCGRNHAYEGYNAGEVVHNIRSLIQWGVKGVILTTASGCLDPKWEAGKLMLFSDQINGTGLSPLHGEFGEGFEPRFVDMSVAFDPKWSATFKKVAKQQKRTLYNGVFYGVAGPQYETPAEIKMFQTVGASAVSMSTALEVIAARQLGAKVAAFSCLTNHGAGIQKEKLAHADVMAMGKNFTDDLFNIVLKTAINLEV